MIGQQATAITFYVHYVDTDGVSVTGLTVTVDVFEGINGTPIVSGGSATELANGLYYYTLASGSVDANGAYICMFETASASVAQRHLPALWSVGVSGLATAVAVDDLPTNAELATSQASADDATLAAIASLNNISPAQVNAEVDTALVDYDGPTFAELDARTDAIDAALVVIAAFLNTEIADILADTNELQTDWVNGGRLDLLVDAIKAVTDALTAAAAAKLALSAATIVSGAAAAGTLSTTAMTTNLTESTDDHYNGRIIIWTSGVLQNQATDITDYNGTTKVLTYTAVTEAPSALDTFIIV